MEIQELKEERIGVCVSGGLDSKTVTARMLEDDLDLVCFTADLGQPDEEDINDIVDKMAPTGAKTVIDKLHDGDNLILLDRLARLRQHLLDRA